MSYHQNWLSIVTRICFIIILITLSFTGIAFAQASDEITITLQPHCVFSEGDDDEWMFGPIPDIPPLISLGEGHCRTFAVEDPRTLRTDPLDNGDILDIDIVVENPSGQDIQHVRSWLNYDTTVLEGVSIDVNEVFSIVAPGEEDFDNDDGFVMVDASAENGDEPSIKRLAIARVKFKVIDTPSAGTVINFYDVQPGGHTEVFKKSDTESDGISVLSTDPGSLHIIFGDDDDDDDDDTSTSLSTSDDDSLLADGETCQIDSQCQSDNCSNGICVSDIDPLPNGSACIDDSDCESDYCDDGLCGSDTSTLPPPPPLLPDGDACTSDSECLSQHCIDGTCQMPPEDDDSDDNDSSDDDTQRTAFSLLQVQNFRVTTEVNSVFLGWDPLQTSRLKAYNIYYGTTTGQYIQRKTIEGTMESLLLRSLPENTRYYFAIRAVSITDEESAFSQEISVVVGDAASSTSPLGANFNFDDPTQQPPTGTMTNPVRNGETVHGETGIPSILAILLFASAVIGTIFASRRQLVVTNIKPLP
ncbi:fibronectin type III domain-containing protein [Patescibacteria group bacterium]|nr:fibronectin type III domain-containing protein [Patescibacteria group bacterium]